MTLADAVYPRSVSLPGRLQTNLRNRPHSPANEMSEGDQPPSRFVATENRLSNQFLPYALRFGRFRLVLHSRELLAGGVPLSVGNRALDVLFALIDARGKLVTKDELLSLVWPSTTVEENNLQFQVSTLRKVLGADRDMIKTVSGRGYRFVAEIMTEFRPSCAAIQDTALNRQAAVVGQICDLSGLGNPCEPTSDIVGRETHLKDLSAMIAGNRLAGAGGIGKARVAIELARRGLPTFANGVRIAKFGRVSDPGLALATVESGPGLGIDSNSLEQIAASLNSKNLLLLLDNCEHIIEAVTRVAEVLLQTNAALQIIATSREPARAQGDEIALLGLSLRSEPLSLA